MSYLKRAMAQHEVEMPELVEEQGAQDGVPSDENEETGEVRQQRANARN